MYWQVGSLPLVPPGKPTKVEKAVVVFWSLSADTVRVWTNQGKRNMILDKAEFTDIGSLRRDSALMSQLRGRYVQLAWLVD